MKTLVLTIALAFAATGANAAESTKAETAPTPQQARMAACNKDAGDRKGDERKAFMKTCLSDKRTSQQDRMKTCNQQAEGKKGDERKRFMGECLRG